MNKGMNVDYAGVTIRIVSESYYRNCTHDADEDEVDVNCLGLGSHS